MSLFTLAFLGGVQIQRDAKPVTRFRSDKALALLAFLAVESDRAFRREELAGLFFPDQPDDAARHNLSQTLWRLRQAIGDTDATRFILVSPHALQFNIASAAQLDSAAFQTLLDECQRHAHAQIETCDACRERLARAAALYRGDLLAGLSLGDSPAFEEWLLVQREMLRYRALNALAALAAFHERRLEFDAANAYARRQIELEIWREEAHRQLIRGLALSNDRSGALAQYDKCRRILDAELGLEPELETRALAEWIRTGEIGGMVQRAPLPANNLPAPLTPFIGRERELSEIRALLEQRGCRLVTLTGLGGMGKTRLALETAARGGNYPDGIYFAALAERHAVEEIMPAVAHALGMERVAAREIVRHLRDKRVLLVLDNFEQLLEGAPRLAELLQQAPFVQCLVTSRQALNLTGEQVYRVEGMAVPPDDDLVAAADSQAVRLFVNAARRAQPQWALRAKNARDVLRICRLVGGMPLAIELAAAWVALLSPREIAVEIERSVEFLTTERRDMAARHRSLRALLDWTWDGLSVPERDALEQLATLPRIFSRVDAEQNARVSLRTLTLLVHKGLVRRDDAGGLVGHFTMHELVRQYAAERQNDARKK